MTVYKNAEHRRACIKQRTEKQQRRYWYCRNVLGMPSWKAVLARESTISLRAMVPDHEFPAELVECEKRGPKKGVSRGKYRVRCKQCGALHERSAQHQCEEKR